MNSLTDRSNLDHLRKQAKDLLRLYRSADPGAFDRLRAALPAARGKSNPALAAMTLRLHDMQSCIAREHGCATWNSLKDEVEIRRSRAQDLSTLRRHWLSLVYGGDVTGGTRRQRPDLAERVLAENPALTGDDPYLACAVGDVASVRRALDADPSWANAPGGELRIPPLVAVSHSCLVKLPAFRDRLLGCLRLLIERGADPNQHLFNRWPPHSLEQPGADRLSALYGVAGKNHDVEATRLLLAAGADGNDGESLYHSCDDPDPSLPCTRALLEAGTRVEGSNALARILDIDNLAGLELLLSYTKHGDPDLGHILHWAIYRGRSAAHVRAILDAGADPKSLSASHQDAFHNAANFGLPEVMRMLKNGGSAGELTREEQFVSACAQADAQEARRLFEPGIFGKLTPAQLKQLPNLAMAGRDDAVRLMVELGWPIAERGGDIDGSALNWAVFRGRPELAEFLLERGASFREQHGYNSDVLGTLSWASLNQPRNDGDWAACAAALLRHGLPVATSLAVTDRGSPNRTVHIDGRNAAFPEDVAEVLLGG
ncbi:MAG TPA: ankyrin repeat domain-containing protein [Steroidobacteraceae bacterium]|nr:ankyrin repeat domain-containing protein [Steroidobacteraceae bacterium]